MILMKQELRDAFADSEGRGPFFTSDLHFGHNKIVDLCGRPWTSDAQTREIIGRWNSRVGLLDPVYHLGDFTFYGPSKIGLVLEILGELNGEIHLIKGNHCDRTLWQRIEDQNLPQIAFIKDYHEMSVEGQRIMLCHYPMETWNGAGHGSWMLHGHCHGSILSRGKRLDVGIDNHPDHQVFCYAEVAAYMKRQKIAIVDHHNGSRP